MRKENYLIKDSPQMLKTRLESKRKVKALINNSNVKAQETYYNIMSIEEVYNDDE